MSAQPSIDRLPETLDVRKAAIRERDIQGVVALASLPRLADFIASQEGQANVSCRFFRDEENRSVVDIAVSADLQVTCQRCLGVMALPVATENRVAIVGDDDAAKQLPASLEPWIVTGEAGNLWGLAEDELILAIPVVSYHDSEDCKRLLDAYRRPPESEDSDGDNPFKVLEQLKASHTEEN